MVAPTTTGLRDSSLPLSTMQQIQWATAAGTADAITAAYQVPNTSLSDGLVLGFRAAFANATTTPTFSPDGLTAYTITKKGGAALLAADIPNALAECIVRYNLTHTRWELLNPGGENIRWSSAGGTADAITATYSVTVAALLDGLMLGFRAAFANATATPTFSPNGLTAKNITKKGGYSLAPGDIAHSGAECIVRYSSANSSWELLNPATSTLNHWAAAAGSADVITAAFSPTVTGLVDGMELDVRAASDNLTTTPTFSPDGLTAHTITKNGGASLVPGDIKANGEYRLRYNLANTRWELTNHTPLGDELFYFLAADDTGGQNVNTAQPWFPTTGGVTVKGNTTYEMEGTLYLSRSAGTTSHTTSLLFGGTATLTAMDYFVDVMTGDADALASTSGVLATDATATVIKAASTSATEQIIAKIRGVVRVNAAGTLIPQFKYSAAPGGTPTTKVASYIRMRPVGNGSVVTKGTWA